MKEVSAVVLKQYFFQLLRKIDLIVAPLKWKISIQKYQNYFIICNYDLLKQLQFTLSKTEEVLI